MFHRISRTFSLLFTAVFILLFSSSLYAMNRVGIRFDTPKIKESQNALVTVFLDSPVEGNTQFYINFSGVNPLTDNMNAYFPTMETITPVQFTTGQKTVTLTYPSVGRIGSQPVREFSAQLMNAGFNERFFEINPTADSSQIQLIDDVTYISLETPVQTIAEGNDVNVRAVLTGPVPFNNGNTEFRVIATPSGEGWTDSVPVEFLIPVDGNCSRWISLPTAVSENIRQRTAYLKITPYSDNMLQADSVAKTFLIVNHYTNNPVATFPLSQITVDEPAQGQTQITEITLQSQNGIPLVGTQIPFTISGTANENTQYKLIDKAFIFDGNKGSAKVRIELLNDEQIKINSTIIFTLYAANPTAQFGTYPELTLTIRNTDRASGVPAGIASFVGNPEITVQETDPANMLIVASGLSGGAVATATFNVSGGKYGVDYIIRGASKPGKGSKFTVTTDSSGWAVFSLIPVNDQIAGEKIKKLKVSLVSVKSEQKKQKFKLANKKVKVNIIDNDPYVNPPHLSMPHVGAKRYIIYNLTDMAARAAGYIEDTALLYLNPAENNGYSELGAEVSVTGNKMIIYNTNTDSFRRAVSDSEFQYGVTDRFNAVVSKAGSGSTLIETTVCIGNYYTKGSVLEIPFSLVNSITDNIIAGQHFTRTPSITGYYYAPFVKIKNGKPQKPQKAALKTAKVTEELNQDLYTEFSKKLLLYNKKLLNESRKGGQFFADAVQSVQEKSVGVELRLKTTEQLLSTGRKGKIDIPVASMIMSPPQTDSVTYFQDFKTKVIVMKVCGHYFGSDPKISLEYRHPSSGKISYYKLKPIKPSASKPAILVSLSGEQDEFISSPPPVYATMPAVIYLTLPAPQHLPKALDARYDLFIESEIGLQGIPRIGIKSQPDVKNPWNEYYYIQNDIIFTRRIIDGIPVVECFRDDGYQNKPMIVLNHGYTQSKDDPAIQSAAVQFARAGFFVMMSDAIGHGDRKNPTGLLPTEISIVWAGEISQMLQTYRHDPRINYNAIGMVGYSMGGSTVYAYLAQYPGLIQTAAAVIATPDLMTITNGPFNQYCQYSVGDIRPSTPEQIARANAFSAMNNPINAWSNMLGVNLTMINGAIDPIIPASGTGALHTLLLPGSTQRHNGLSLNYVNGAGHVNTPEMIQMQLLWMEQYTPTLRSGNDRR